MKIFRSLAVSLLFVHPAFAAHDIQIQGSTSYPLSQLPQASLHAQAPVKSVRLLDIKLSANAWDKIEQNLAHSSQNQYLIQKGNLPSQVQLGMNQVPVLDQGPYGTCVTFAVTAAIDAAIGNGDYLSQLCQLQLGRYLEQNSYAPSGWDGSTGPNVLTQMEMFGFVTKQDERRFGCGGLTDYPTDGITPKTNITPEEFHTMSHSLEDLPDAIHWSTILDSQQVFQQESDRNQTLDAVKKALNSGDRLTFGVLLFLPEYGVMGAMGQHQVQNDTWLITPVIRSAIRSRGLFGGHEMIITGYDDNAVAIDPIGIKHHGLLTLRNSWSDQIGDAGNFYMTYDYFKLLTIGIERIRHS